MLSTTKTAVANARKLRRKMTLPEVLLWQRLRLRPGGLEIPAPASLRPVRLGFLL